MSLTPSDSDRGHSLTEITHQLNGFRATAKETSSSDTQAPLD